MPRNPISDFKNIRVFQAVSPNVNGAAGTCVPVFTNTIAKGLIARILVQRTTGDAANFGIEVRDDATGTADDDNRWFYLASGARTKYDGIPDSQYYLNRDNPIAQTIQMLIPFTGGTAVNQGYTATLWVLDYGNQQG